MSAILYYNKCILHQKTSCATPSSLFFTHFNFLLLCCSMLFNDHAVLEDISVIFPELIRIYEISEKGSGAVEIIEFWKILVSNVGK